MKRCKIAIRTDEFERYKCTITDSDCMYLIPDSQRCAKEFGEGPDSKDVNYESEVN